MISIKVPARICFFGDHQDYLGLPVIAGTINRFIELKATPISEHEFQLELADVQDSRAIPLDIENETVPTGDYLLSSMAILRSRGFRFEQGYQVVISGNIPVNAGLSSSSALTVAWIRFLVGIQKEVPKVSDAQIGHWAYEAEVEFFDSPGGLMDQYTIAQQGLLFIDTKNGQTKRLKGGVGDLVVAESGISKVTLDVLKNARIFQEKAIAQVKARHHEFDIMNSTSEDYETYLNSVLIEYRQHWYAVVHNYDITKKARRLLLSQGNNLEQLGSLMNAHQKILEECIQNTPAQMAKMMNAARKAGALGAKTIGSGGGGCMVALVSNTTKKNVVKAFTDNGAKAAYEVELTYPEYEK